LTNTTLFPTRRSSDLTETTDGILANNCLLGDELAFEGLYKRYRPALFKFIFNILRDYDLSCDILQQVFLQLYISLPTLKTNKPLDRKSTRLNSSHVSI